VYLYNWSGGKKIYGQRRVSEGGAEMNFIYCEKIIAKRVGLSRRALNRFRTESMTEGVDWGFLMHDSRKKTALSDSGLLKLVSGLKNGLLTGGEPVLADISEIKKNAALRELPTEEGQMLGGMDQESEILEKKPRAVIGLLPAPVGCGGSPLEALLVVYRHPNTVPNKRTLICKLKGGQMPPHHERAVTDEHGTAYCRVTTTEKFVVGMEVMARFDGGNVWNIARPCPRRRGKW
jgi:hypothetical protein